MTAPTDYELNLYAARIRLNLEGLLDHQSSEGKRSADARKSSTGKSLIPSVPSDAVIVEWRELRACDADIGDWFDIPNYSLKGQRNYCAPLIAVCSDCLVRAECLEDAMSRNEPNGIWGGLLPKERRALRRRRAGGSVSSKCGTVAGYAQHRRNNESQCEDCKRANRQATARRRAK